jgi:hypothetical protein
MAKKRPGRPPNDVETVSLPLSTTPRVVKMLRWLVANRIGYGKNPAEAADRILGTELEKLFDQFEPDLDE